MRTYRFALVLTTQTGKEEAKAKKLVDSLVSEASGKVKETRVLGVRDLAYPIKKETKGWYALFTLELPENKSKSFVGQLKLNETVLRYLLIVKS
jgi:small subunit ribosomal protein S6